MKTISKLYAVGLLALTACSADTELSELSDRVPINLGYTTVTANETRASANTALNDVNIASGRAVRVRISTDGGTSYTDYDYTTGASGTMTPPSAKPYYPASGTVKIVAYHPSTASTSFTINNNQTTDANYNASDLMFSNNVSAQEKTTNTVNLQFRHKMAKIVVNATKGDGVNYIESITLKNVKPTVSFNQSTGAVGTATGTAVDVSIFSGGGSSNTTASGAAVIPGQTLEGNFLEIETDQGTASYDIGGDGYYEFTSNSKTTLNITVNKTAVGVTNSVSWTSGSAVTVQPTVVNSPLTVMNVTTSHVGWLISSDGYVYQNKSAVDAANKTAVAMICYVGNAGSADASGNYRGLAIALSDANSHYRTYWCSQESATCLNTRYTSFAGSCEADINGIANTMSLIKHASHTHYAAQYAVSNNGTKNPYGTSGWFLPTMGQYKLILTGLCSKAGQNYYLDDTNEGEGTEWGDVESVFTAAGIGSSCPSTDSFWSSTEYANNKAWYYNGSDGDAYYGNKHNDSSSNYVRSFCAF